MTLFTENPLRAWSFTSFTNNSFNICYAVKPVLPLVLQMGKLRHQEIKYDLQVRLPPWVFDLEFRRSRGRFSDLLLPSPNSYASLEKIDICIESHRLSSQACLLTFSHLPELPRTVI